MARLLIYTAYNLNGFRNESLSSAFTSAMIKYNVSVRRTITLIYLNF